MGTNVFMTKGKNRLGEAKGREGRRTETGVLSEKQMLSGIPKRMSKTRGSTYTQRYTCAYLHP